MKIEVLKNKGFGIKITKKDGTEKYFGTFNALYKLAYKVTIQNYVVTIDEKVYIPITREYTNEFQPEQIEKGWYNLLLSGEQLYNFYNYLAKKKEDLELRKEFEKF